MSSKWRRRNRSQDAKRLAFLHDDMMRCANLIKKGRRNMTNQELMLTRENSTEFLTGIQIQQRFLLRQANAKVPCPNCGTKQNQFEASGVDIEKWDFSTANNELTFKCIACERELKEAIPLHAFGAVKWHWQLVPVEVTK